MSIFKLASIGPLDVVEMVEPGELEKVRHTATLSGKIEINYPNMLNGGGILFLNDIYKFIEKSCKKKYKRAFEWCCGPGFLSYEALGRGLAEEIVGSDFYLPAIENFLETADKNNVRDKVTAYHTPLLENIPDDEQWDLVLGNPPWFPDYPELVDGYRKQVPHCTDENIVHHARIGLDNQWKTHKEFFSNLQKHVNHETDIYITEGWLFLDEVFKIIDDTGFEILEHYTTDYPFPNPFIKLQILRIKLKK